MHRKHYILDKLVKKGFSSSIICERTDQLYITPDETSSIAAIFCRFVLWESFQTWRTGSRTIITSKTRCNTDVVIRNSFVEKKQLRDLEKSQ
jgi:hypothetical protein